jgi:hypothetical protein
LTASVVMETQLFNVFETLVTAESLSVKTAKFGLTVMQKELLGLAKRSI